MTSALVKLTSSSGLLGGKATDTSALVKLTSSSGLLGGKATDTSALVKPHIVKLRNSL
ncbi:MAG: hypothetical protein FWF94_02410 [Oscillospiraceae bacterium]|nr:hypothetical protein [Oscillospiraceae bacterium]